MSMHDDPRAVPMESPTAVLDILREVERTLHATDQMACWLRGAISPVDAMGVREVYDHLNARDLAIALVERATRIDAIVTECANLLGAHRYDLRSDPPSADVAVRAESSIGLR